MKRLLLTCTDLMAIQFLVPHIKFLSQNGFEVELACSDAGGRLDGLHKELNGIAQIHTVNLARSPWSPHNPKGYRELKKLICGGDWDVIWTNEPVMGVMTRLAAKKSRRNGTKVVYMVHGFHFYKGAPVHNWLMYYPAEKHLSRLCDMIITVNEEDYRRARTFHPARAERIPGVGVDLSRYAPDEKVRFEWRKKLGLAEDDIALLTVGELHKGKNQRCVIEAADMLKEPRFHCFICGKGEEEGRLRKLAEKRGIADRVHFLGYREDVAQIMCACDIFVFMSKREGLPRALTEAMASGMAVVCSRIRGNTDLVDEGKGGFILPDDASEVARAVRLLADDERLRADMGAHNRSVSEAFCEKESLEDVLELMRSCL